MKHAILKVGHTVVVDNSNRIKPEGIEAISLLAHEIAGAGRFWPTIITTGAVACGLAALPNIELESPIVGNSADLQLKQVLAAVGQPRLMAMYNQELAQYSLPTSQMLLSQHDLGSRDAAQTFLQTHRIVTGIGSVPIINENDALATEAFRDDNLALSLGIASLIKPARVIAIEDTADDLYAEPYFGTHYEAFRTLARTGMQIDVVPIDKLYEVSQAVNLAGTMPGDRVR